MIINKNFVRQCFIVNKIKIEWSPSSGKTSHFLTINELIRDELVPSNKR